MEEIGYAKINLALHVRERLPDGYHRIETLFAFAEEGDRLSVSPADGVRLQVVGPFAAVLGNGEDNLVLRAARALRDRYAVATGAALRLDKRLPVASGIGGGSADAAAALRLLARWWSLPAERGDLMEIAAGLGADVPACLESRTARGEGRGDRLQPADGSLTATPLLLVNPGVPVSTAGVFRGWNGQDLGPLPEGPISALTGRNDLEASARALAPEIGEVLRLLGRMDGATLVRMSGSGATCFALFESTATLDAAAAKIGEIRPDWWQLKSRLR